MTSVTIAADQSPRHLLRHALARGWIAMLTVRTSHRERSDAHTLRADIAARAWVAIAARRPIGLVHLYAHATVARANGAWGCAETVAGIAQGNAVALGIADSARAFSTRRCEDFNA